MRWFKHYHNASYSVSLSELIDELGVSGYGHYWLLLELLAEKYDGKSTTFIIHFEEISRKVRIKFEKKLEKFIRKLPESCVTFEKIRPKVYKIEAPIMAELQGRDFKKARSERADTAPKIKTKIKTKNKIKIEEKEACKNFETEKKLIESWNALAIMQHNLCESNYKKIEVKLKKRLGHNTIDEILKAMKNYHEALTVGWFSYKWSLWDFLSRESANKFYPDEYVRENFIKQTPTDQVKNLIDKNPFRKERLKNEQ